MVGEWEERLSLEEAWELAETLDAVSTSGTESRGGEQADSF